MGSCVSLVIELKRVSPDEDENNKEKNLIKAANEALNSCIKKHYWTCLNYFIKKKIIKNILLIGIGIY